MLVTAGGTREAIDPVRVITNRSSGKQGYALAAEAAGPRGPGHPGHHRRPARPPGRPEVVAVETAAEMEAAVVPRAATATWWSWPPRWPTSARRRPADGKIKKADGVPEVVLEPTHDFLVDLGRAKPPGQVLVGFAAETDDVDGQRPAQARPSAST